MALATIKILVEKDIPGMRVEYTPGETVRRTLLLPATVLLSVEFPTARTHNAFQKAEYLYFIDGYMRVVGGEPEVSVGKEEGYIDRDWEEKTKGDGTVASPSSICSVLLNGMDAIVEYNLARVKRMEGGNYMRLGIVFTKLGMVDEALRCFREEGYEYAFLIESVYEKRHDRAGLERICRDAGIEADRKINTVVEALRAGRCDGKTLHGIPSKIGVDEERMALFLMELSKVAEKVSTRARCLYLGEVLSRVECTECGHERKLKEALKREIESSLKNKPGLLSKISSGPRTVIPELVERRLGMSREKEFELTLGREEKKGAQNIAIKSPVVGTRRGEKTGIFIVDKPKLEKSVTYTTGRLVLEMEGELEICELEGVSCDRRVRELGESGVGEKSTKLSTLSPLAKEGVQKKRYTFFVSKDIALQKIRLLSGSTLIEKSFFLEVVVVPDPIPEWVYDHRYYIFAIPSVNGRDLQSLEEAFRKRGRECCDLVLKEGSVNVWSSMGEVLLNSEIETCIRKITPISIQVEGHEVRLSTVHREVVVKGARIVHVKRKTEERLPLSREIFWTFPEKNKCGKVMLYSKQRESF
jgi:hypothetical protein